MPIQYATDTAGAIELVKACREAGLKVAVASSADRVKVRPDLSMVSTVIAISCASAMQQFKQK